MKSKRGNASTLYRLHFRRRSVSATSGMVWAHAAKWVFRQTPKARHAGNGCTGFEVNTRRPPYAAKEALEASTGGEWEMLVLWSRPAQDGEGEGSRKGKNPWRNGWPSSDRQTD